jgi:3-deoxy-D-manno-octulosonic acid kinase
MGTPPAASDTRQPFRDERGPGAIVFDPARLRQATPDLLDPAGYDAQAQLIAGDGGRGAAWFVHGPFGDGVLRQYRRGGWMASLSKDRYVWRGESHVRSIVEYSVLGDLRSLGLPVPAPIAAAYWRGAFSYSAAILIERLAGVRSFAGFVSADADTAPWAAVGATIARFHRLGARHSDLNAHNVLVDKDAQVWLIDWDKGRRVGGPGAWCDAVLDRLERSLRKVCAGLPDAEISQGMGWLRQAHQRGLSA